MKSLALLGACATLPWLMCLAMRPSPNPRASGPGAAHDRRLGRFRRHTLFLGGVGIVCAAVLGAWWVDPALATRSPTAGCWFFSSLCATTAWASLALGRRTPDEARAMPTLPMIGRTVQLAFVPVIAAGLSLVVVRALPQLLSLRPIAGALLSALLSVAAALVASPWLAMKLGVWRVLPREVEADGASWRLVHLPVPAPFFVHAAAMPWLGAILVSEGLFHYAPVEHWQALVQYEGSGALSSRRDRAMRWALAIPLCVSAFVIASAIGARGAHAMVAATVIAVCFTLASGWLANRQPASRVVLGANGPSMRELAQTLRSLPPPYRQALPRTSHHPLGSALYDRLFSLGHDPGPRPEA
ncbi:MAG: hypothetical protein WAU39_10565 [Polyangiales bacterium]